MYVYPNYGYKKPKKRWPLLLFTFMVAVSGSYLVQTYLTTRQGTKNDVQRLSNEEKYVEVEPNYNRADVIEDVMESVVGIGMLKVSEDSLFDVLATDKWGLGTGVIVSEDGYILTNQHLARKENTKLIVTLSSGETVQGKVIWCNENIDLAIVKIDRNNLKKAKLGNSDTVRIGDEVLAIGNPLGVEFQRTTTSGIISGVNRTLTFEEDGETVFMEDLIQTDASINSGNSGGPLISENGEVIGINTVKITSAEGIGFAVPINFVTPIIDRLVAGLGFREAYLGVFVYDKEIVKYADSKISISQGLYVTNVTKKSPAETAGLSKGDIIISIDGVSLNKVTDLRSYIYTKEPGDTVSMIVNRNNNIENVKVKLGEK